MVPKMVPKMMPKLGPEYSPNRVWHRSMTVLWLLSIHTMSGRAALGTSRQPSLATAISRTTCCQPKKKGRGYRSGAIGQGLQVRGCRSGL